MSYVIVVLHNFPAKIEGLEEQDKHGYMAMCYKHTLPVVTTN